MITVGGVHRDARDVPTCVQTFVLPGGSPVIGPVNPQTKKTVAAGVGFPGSNPNGFRITGINGHGSATEGRFVFKLGYPINTPVDGLEDAAAGQGGVSGVGIGGVHGQIRHPTANVHRAALHPSGCQLLVLVTIGPQSAGFGFLGRRLVDGQPETFLLDLSMWISALVPEPHVGRLGRFPTQGPFRGTVQHQRRKKKEGNREKRQNAARHFGLRGKIMGIRGDPRKMDDRIYD